MGRLLSKSAKVVHRRDQSRSEEVIPDAIRHNAGGEWVFGADQIIGKLQSATICRVVRSLIDRLEESPGFWLSGLFMVAPLEYRLVKTSRFPDSGNADRVGESGFCLAVFVDELVQTLAGVCCVT